MAHLPPEPVCARCPKKWGKSCCEVGPGDKLATLTVADVERIRGHLRKSPASFVDVEWWDEPQVARYVQGWPSYGVYFRHHWARWTLKASSGACLFLDRVTGCRLPATVRPTACLLYPFSPDGDGPEVLQTSPGNPDAPCLAVDEAASPESLLAAMGMALPDWQAVRRRLRDELAEHAQETGPTGRYAAGCP